MKKDLNRNISLITYNSLNLPLTVTFSTGHRILYSYDAMGNLQRVTYQDAILNKPCRYRTTLIRDYVGSLIFENGDLKHILTSAGFVEDGEYYYQLRDYQGNNRVVIDGDGTVLERNNYYPFGLPITDEHHTSSVTPRKYGNKEFDTTNGLNTYDFGARQYDPAILRFTTADPLAEQYYALSPYLYCAANPILLIDPTGLGWVEVKISADKFIIYDPDVHSTQDALKTYTYGHITYLGEFADLNLIIPGGNSQTMSIKLMGSGGFSINGEKWYDEYDRFGLHIGDKRNVTINNNYYGYYLGNKNPENNNNDSYVLPPRSRLDYAAFLHDRAYDKKNAKGAGDALINIGVIDADARLALSAASIYLTTLNPLEKCWSYLVLRSFGVITISKAMGSLLLQMNMSK